MTTPAPTASPNRAPAPAVTTRRGFVGWVARALALVGLGALAGRLAWPRRRHDGLVWQLDPHLCMQCGRCATECVLRESAVKCVHNFAMCGYCELCTGYFIPDPVALDTGAENQLCPTGALERHFVEDPYYEYTVVEPLCVGCGKCVKGCVMFGNGSLFLQVRHDRCLNCNECRIARHCPTNAFRLVPASQPYLFKGREEQA